MKMGDGIPIRNCDLYVSNEPPIIWSLYGGDQLLENQAFYFFTRMKKLSPKTSRFTERLVLVRGRERMEPSLFLLVALLIRF